MRVRAGFVFCFVLIRFDTLFSCDFFLIFLFVVVLETERERERRQKESMVHMEMRNSLEELVEGKYDQNIFMERSLEKNCYI